MVGAGRTGYSYHKLLVESEYSMFMSMMRNLGWSRSHGVSGV
jgi:hypothetical protein